MLGSQSGRGSGEWTISNTLQKSHIGTQHCTNSSNINIPSLNEVAL